MKKLISKSTNFYNVWKSLNRPYHAEDSETHYREYANEISSILAKCNFDKVLEIGCGNGALYSHLNFVSKNYKGVDFSPSMLESFKLKYPGINISCCDGSTYCDKEKYDLIFSNGVIQYFNTAMLKKHFENGYNMLTENGVIFCGSVPCSCMQSAYYRGFFNHHPYNQFKGYLYYIYSLFVSKIGYWYNFTSFTKIARQCGFSVTYFGSKHYPYRFHALLRKSS